MHYTAHKYWIIYLLLARSFIIKKFSKIFINLKESIIIKGVTHRVALVDAESLLHGALPPDPMSVRGARGSFPRHVRASPRVAGPGARSVLSPGLRQRHSLGWECKVSSESQISTKLKTNLVCRGCENSLYFVWELFLFLVSDISPPASSSSLCHLDTSLEISSARPVVSLEAPSQTHS